MQSNALNYMKPPEKTTENIKLAKTKKGEIS
jgi:hypothetical protein